MGVASLSSQEVADRALSSLGLDGFGVDLFSVEALAAALRRVASFNCPATHNTLIRTVRDAFRGLPGFDDDAIRNQLDIVLDALIGVGDLQELPSANSDDPKRMIYLGSPACVRRESGTYLFIGVRPDGEPFTTGALTDLIEYEGHLRLVRPTPDVDGLVAESDITPRAMDQWLGDPGPRSAPEVIARYAGRLGAAGPSGDIEGAKIIDSATRVTFYRGRWREPKAGDSGMYVARRPQAYGADLWCVAQLDDGHFSRLVDLPLFGSLFPAADEAWVVQAALDAERGNSQRLRVSPTSGGEHRRFDFFSPLPSWAQRRLDLFGTPVLAGRGALFSYSLPTSEVDEELTFFSNRLWMSIDTEPERTRS